MEPLFILILAFVLLFGRYALLDFLALIDPKYVSQPQKTFAAMLYSLIAALWLAWLAHFIQHTIT